MTSTSTANSAVPGVVNCPPTTASSTPTSRLPTIAPQMESRPPITAPASARSENFVIANGVSPPNAGPSSAAASPASAPAAIHANRYTRFTGTPISCATVGSPVVARTASPKRVREKKR